MRRGTKIVLVICTPIVLVVFANKMRWNQKNSDDTPIAKDEAKIDMTLQKTSEETPRKATENLSKKNKTEKAVFPKCIDLSSGITLKMVKCSAGSFMMGSPDTEAHRRRKETLHRVTLTKSFWIGKTEVTQSQWKAVMGENPSYFKGDDLPVETVSWEDAMKFCEKLNEKFREKLPQGYEFSLPTEAQWEYACRGGKKSRSYMTFSGSNTFDDVAWTVENSGSKRLDSRSFKVKVKKNMTMAEEVKAHLEVLSENNSKTHPVGRKQRNELGLYDMSGNVWEMCYDWYNDKYQGDAKDPLVSAKSMTKVVRGGSWDFDSFASRSAFRFNLMTSERSNTLGFRLALRPIQK